MTALALICVGDAELLDELDEVDAAGAGARVDDRVSLQQRRFDGIDRGNVGLRRAGFHGEADGGAGEIRRASVDQDAVRDQLVDAFAGEDRYVGCFAALDAWKQHGGRAVARLQLDTVRVLEVGDDIVEDALYGHRAQEFHRRSVFLIVAPRRPIVVARERGQMSRFSFPLPRVRKKWSTEVAVKRSS